MKVGVWCAVSARRIVGPVFFKETINCGRYVQIILGQFFPELIEEEILYDLFQQDSTTAHNARMSLRTSYDVFGDKIMSSGIWPACSPDLKHCDCFFWGCLKDKIYNSNPGTEEELKANIRKEIANIPVERLQKVNQKIFRRCEECLRVDGQHFQHLLGSVNKGKNFPIFRMLSANRHADSSTTCATPFSNMCSTQADRNSRKFPLRYGCQFPWCALALSERSSAN
jgi:hypothetical protein